VKLLNEIQRVIFPPGQSRADRPVASVAIRRATGGCEAYTARKQAAKISSEIVSHCDADALVRAEGSIRTTGKCEVEPGSPESLARGMFPQGFPRDLGRAPHLLLTTGGTGG
jgi:hypothetical protein